MPLGEGTIIFICGALAVVGMDYIARAWREIADEEAAFGDVIELPVEMKGARIKGGGGGAPSDTNALLTSQDRTHGGEASK